MTTDDGGYPALGGAERLGRRTFMLGAAAGLGAWALGGCAPAGMSRAEAERAYAAVPDERFPIPAVNLDKVKPKYLRHTVRYASNEAPGTIIVDPRNHFVYRIEGEGNATRYGVSVGRQGFLWNGEAYIGRKAEWPVWTPPKEMIKRQPEVAKYAGGMEPGLDNPLGARVLYLYQDGKYTLYTLYSTIQPQTIGNGISSGCIGFLTQDMLDLYERTPVGTKVIVLKA
jgi:lipoprotein-anchoring transpeptidase ErfK/SrfK